MVGQSYSDRSGGCCSLQGCLDQWGPDDRGGSGRGSGGSLDVVSTVCHFPVVLHNLLDDLILLVVENTRIEVMLDFVQQNGIFLACSESEERKESFWGVSEWEGSSKLPARLPSNCWHCLPSTVIIGSVFQL